MSVYIRELARQLGEQGHSVDVYTRVHDPRDPQIVNLGQRTRLIHLRAGDIEEIHKLAVYFHLPDFTCNLENFRQNNGLEYDLVFSHYWLSGWVGQYLQRWWQVPHIAMFHTLGAVKNAISISKNDPELRIATERDLAQSCHHIIATTHREKEDLTQFYGASPERISVIPCGVNLELFQPVDKDTARQRLGFTDEKIILFVGRIEPLKGIEQLLRAVSYLPDRQGWKLVVIGGDESNQNEMEGLKKLSRTLEIQDSVAFLGLKRHEQLPDFYSAADICVVPSYYESFGLVALESLACGTPVVGTDVGALTNIIHQGKNGYVLANNDPRHLADKIASLLSRPFPDGQSPLILRASISSFNWSNIAEAVAQQFHQVLADYLAPVP
jgi:D-inositol-3-phosphate glycosyltransferase